MGGSYRQRHGTVETIPGTDPSYIVACFATMAGGKMAEPSATCCYMEVGYCIRQERAVI